LSVKDFPERPQGAAPDSEAFLRWQDQLRQRQNIDDQQLLDVLVDEDEFYVFHPPTGKTYKTTLACIATGIVVGGTPIYIVSGTFSGIPATNQYIMVHTFTIAASFASGLANSSGFAEFAATGSTAIDIRKRLSASSESSIGTMIFGAGGSVPTFTFASTTTFAIGDSMVLRMGTADATLSDFGWSIRGTR
jgi:hypothetical protein